MLHQELKWDPASVGNTTMCILFPIAYRCGAYCGVLSEEVEATIPAASTYKWTKIPPIVFFFQR
jgi:hypothetical protein